MNKLTLLVVAALAAPAYANPPTFEESLVAQRARLGWALLQGGTVLNLAVGPADFYPWARISPYQRNVLAPPAVRVVNVVVNSGLAPIPRAANSPVTIGSVVAKDAAARVPAIGTVTITNASALREVNTNIKAPGM